MRKIEKFGCLTALVLALTVLTACGGSSYAPAEESSSPSESVPVVEEESPVPSEAAEPEDPSETEPEDSPEAEPEDPPETGSEDPLETGPETPSESLFVMKPVEFTAEDWAEYVGKYVSLTTGIPLEIGEYGDDYAVLVSRPGDYRHLDILLLTPGEGAVYLAHGEPLHAYASLTLQDGKLLLESTGEDSYYDTFVGLYAPSDKSAYEEQAKDYPGYWQEVSPWGEEILALHLGDYVKEDTEVHLQIMNSLGSFRVSTPSPGSPHHLECFVPKLIAAAIQDNGDGSFYVTDEYGTSIIGLTIENGRLSVENISGMPDYEYLAGEYKLTDPVPSELEEYAGLYEDDQGRPMEIGYVCGKLKLQLPTDSTFSQETFYLSETDGKLYGYYNDGGELDIAYWSLTPQDGGLLLEHTIANIEPVLYHRVGQAG